MSCSLCVCCRLVATKAIRIPRRDFLKVDVKNTWCELLLDALSVITGPYSCPNATDALAVTTS